MKIAFVGKGGSGKTTLSALFARWLAAQGKTVLAFDGDVNQHLAVALGETASQKSSLASLLPEIKEYLRGTNVRIPNVDHMIKTTPPGRGSRLLSAQPQIDPLLGRLMAQVNGVWVASAGELEESDLGVKCFHGKSGVIELLLSHIVDKPDELVLVDLTAGADPFASSILAKVDLIVLVVEPSLPSLTVFEQFVRYKQDWVPPFFVIGNKVADVGDEEWLRHRLGDALHTWLPVSDFVRQEARGSQQSIDTLEPAVQASFEVLATQLPLIERNWAAYQQRNYDLHRKNALWANKSVGADVTKQIDAHFSYAKVAMP